MDICHKINPQTLVLWVCGFKVINKVLYIQRQSTDCAGSNYQIVNSCYSLATDEMLAIDEIVDNTISETIIYPNPTSGIFLIKSKEVVSNYSLSFYTIEGKFITPLYKEVNSNEIQVNLDGYKNGIYFIIVYDKNQNKYNFLKIIKR